LDHAAVAGACVTTVPAMEEAAMQFRKYVKLSLLLVVIVTALGGCKMVIEPPGGGKIDISPDYFTALEQKKELWEQAKMDLITDPAQFMKDNSGQIPDGASAADAMKAINEELRAIDALKNASQGGGSGGGGSGGAAPAPGGPSGPSAPPAGGAPPASGSGGTVGTGQGGGSGSGSGSSG
jgi:hypothetical protein